LLLTALRIIFRVVQICVHAKTCQYYTVCGDKLRRFDALLIFTRERVNFCKWLIEHPELYRIFTIFIFSLVKLGGSHRPESAVGTGKAAPIKISKIIPAMVVPKAVVADGTDQSGSKFKKIGTSRVRAALLCRRVG